MRKPILAAAMVALVLTLIAAATTFVFTGSTAANTVTAGVNTMPAVRTWRDSTCSNVNTGTICGPYHPNPDGWYSTRPEYPAQINTDIALAKSIGVKALRFDFPWPFLEPTQGTYDFTRADYIVNALNAAGITAEPFLAFTPFWSNTNATVAPSTAQFSAITTAVVTHFKGRISYLEFWNEPDHGHYWNSGYASFMSSVLIPGFQAAKAVDPNIQIIFPGLSNAAFTTFWNQAVTSGAQNDFDIMGVHDYAGTVGNVVSAAHNWLASIGRANVPVVVGETGISSTSGAQNTYVDAMFNTASTIVNWYELRDDVIYDPTGASVLIQTAGYGLFQHDGTAKPSAAEYAKLSGGPSPVPSLSPSPTPLASPSPTPSPPSGGLSPLHVAGNQLVNASGQTVVLHGANMAGTEFVCAQNYSNDPFGGQPEDNQSTFAAMRSWGINAVRIPLNEDCWLNINGVQIGGFAYQNAVSVLVRHLEAAGFYVIVDLHWTAPGAQRALAQNPVPDEDHSPLFWKSVGATFAGDTGVLYDLFNEPFFYWIASGGPSAQVCLWTGCILTQFETGGNNTSGLPCDPSNGCFTVDVNWQSAGFTELTADIRNTGAPNVLLAAGVNWARDPSGYLNNLPADPNTAIAWHSYPSGNPSLPSECAAQSCWDSVIAPLAAVRPVVVGETGDSTAGPETYLPTFLPWAAGHGLSVLAWTWNAWGNPSDVLVTNMTTGAPTTGEGVTYKAWLSSQPMPSPSPLPSASPTPSPAPSASPSPASSPSPSPSPTGPSFTETIVIAGFTCTITVSNGVVSGVCK